jgi:hypothetical protein
MLPVIISVVALLFSVASWLGYRIMWDHREMAELADTLARIERIAERMELATFVVASDLSEAQTTVKQVATDLAESQHRADAIIEGSPGQAADAGAQSGPTTA